MSFRNPATSLPLSALGGQLTGSQIADGALDGKTITGNTITGATITGSIFQTDVAPAPRIAIGYDYASQIRFFSGTPNESNAANITAGTNPETGAHVLSIGSGFWGTASRALLQLITADLGASSAVMVSADSISLDGPVTVRGPISATNITTPSDWTLMGTGGGWIAYGGGFSSPGARRMLDGSVILRGLGHGGALGPAWQIPPALGAPSTSKVFTVQSDLGTARVDVSTTGLVSVVRYNNGASNLFVSLDGLRFSTL